VHAGSCDRDWIRSDSGSGFSRYCRKEAASVLAEAETPEATET
jgi:hypothetical protein